MKIEIHANFRDKNNILAYFFFPLICQNLQFF